MDNLFKHNLFKIIKLVIQLSILFIFYSCHSGGTVVGSYKSLSSVPYVENVSVVTPTERPYYSALSYVEVSGMCTDGSTIQVKDILGFVVDTTTCVGAIYTSQLFESNDGVYSYYFYQVDESGNLSSPAVFVWVKKSTIAKPLLTYPTSSPHRSSADTLTITGSCESGAEITVEGDVVASGECLNSSFSIDLEFAAQGSYNLNVKQTDQAQNSAYVSLNVLRYDLNVTPTTVTLVAGTSQTFVITGGTGTGTYTMTQTTNNSGGSLDDNLFIYYSGTLANQTDTFNVVDSEGVSKTVTVSTVAGVADHFNYGSVSGDGQYGYVNEYLTQNLSFQVADRYDNGVAFFPVLAQVTHGNGSVSGTTLYLSDINGQVDLQAIPSSNSILNKIYVKSFSSNLQDLGLSGRTSLFFTYYTDFEGTGIFGSQYSTQNTPAQIKMVDINKDNLKDVLVLNVDSFSLSVYTSNANGQLSLSALKTSLCASVNFFEVGDINKDGNQDVMLSCRDVGNANAAAQWLQGYGDGTFSNLTSINFDGNYESTISKMVLIDFDGDTYLDLILLDSVNNFITIRYGSSGGNFSAPIAVTIINDAIDFVVADMNNDSLKDIILVSSSNSIFQVLVNQGSNSFDTGQIFGNVSNPDKIQAYDFNGDGYQDLAILSSGQSSLGIYYNDQSAQFSSADVTLNTGGLPLNFVINDFDQDTFVDIAVLNNNDSTLSVFYGNNTLTFDAVAPISTLGSPLDLAFGDINSDNLDDLIVTGAVDNVFQVLPGKINRGFGFYSDTDVLPIKSVNYDINADGDQDLVVLNRTTKTVKVYKGEGNGQFSLQTTLSTGDVSSGLEIIDTRRSGHPDIIVTNTVLNQVRIFIHNSNFTYESFATDLVGSAGVNDVAVFDVNQDSYQDVVVVNTTANSISVFLNKADGTGDFYSRVNYTTDQSPAKIKIADINNDGKVDVVTTNTGSNSISILMGNGDGTFRVHTEIDVPTSPIDFLITDLNSDDYLDIAVLCTTDEVVSVMLGAGDGSFGTYTNYSLGASPSGLWAGDFNNDGKVDLLSGNSDNGTFTIGVGNGSGVYSTISTITTVNSAYMPIAADFDNNHTLDIITLDQSNNIFQFWMGR